MTHSRLDLHSDLWCLSSADDLMIFVKDFLCTSKSHVVEGKCNFSPTTHRFFHMDQKPFPSPLPKTAPLKSILSLACAAACAPSAAEAAIIVGSINQTVGFGPGQESSVVLDLPGSLDLTLQRFASANRQYAIQAVFPNANPIYGTSAFIARQAGSRSQFPGAQGGWPGGEVAFRTGANTVVNWDNGAITNRNAFAANIVHSGTRYVSTSFQPWQIFGPGGFSETKYLLFRFQPTPNTPRYGWVEMTEATISFQNSSAMSVTFGRWAYDDSGAVIGAGVIPEPSSATLLMGGALLAGAAGLRRWRKQQQEKKTAEPTD